MRRPAPRVKPRLARDKTYPAPTSGWIRNENLASPNARKPDGSKILGAGLASSFGESHFSLESDAVERLPFSVERAVHTPYKHDAFQPRYLVSQSFEQTIAEVLALTPERLLAL